MRHGLTVAGNVVNSGTISGQNGLSLLNGLISGAIIDSGTIVAGGPSHKGILVDGSGGTLDVLSGATISITKLSGGGTLDVSSGATVRSTILIAPVSGGNVRFSGGGTVSMGLNDAISIASGTTFTNVNNTIAGAGLLTGSGVFINSGTVEADIGSQPLNIANSATDVNAGTLKAISSGDLFIGANLINSATIAASGGGFLEIGGCTVSNTAKGVILASGGGLAEIFNATVSGGKVEALSGGTVVLSAAGVSGSVTIAAGALVETFAGGTALVHGNVHNSGGTLFASGASSLIEILSGTVVSGGLVEIGNGTIDVRSGGTASVFFMPTGSGGLIIADMSGSTAAYNGTVSGFGGMNHTNHAQFIDLTSVSFASGQIHLSYTSAAGSGTLSVVSGATLVAAITMIGSYTSANFSATSGSDGKVQIVDPAVVNGGTVSTSLAQTFPRNGIDLPNIAFGAHTTLAYSENAAGTGVTVTVTDGRHAASVVLFGNYMAGSFVTAADGHGGTLVTAQQPLLARPRGRRSTAAGFLLARYASKRAPLPQRSFSCGCGRPAPAA
jgi:antigen 43